jgi:DNA repair exonuclease SbcCD ATPase subunit
MLEYQQITVAVMWPSKCFCGSQTGPFVDTFIERNGERVYICKSCAKRVSRVFGFADGAQLDRLMNASDELDKALAGQEKVQARFEEKLAELEERDRTIVRLTAELQEAHGKVEQLEHVARQVREAAGELVGSASEGVSQ